MITILRVGLGVLVLGLNIMMVWKMLVLTNTETSAVVAKIKSLGKSVVIAGFLIIIIGVFRLFNVFPSWPANPYESSAIITTGASIGVLGLLWILRTKGHGHEGWVKNGAWFVTGIGVGFILAYAIIVYVLHLAT